jgi:hypothetical protein
MMAPMRAAPPPAMVAIIVVDMGASGVLEGVDVGVLVWVALDKWMLKAPAVVEVGVVKIVVVERGVV